MNIDELYSNMPKLVIAVVTRARKNLALMLSEKGKFIPSYDEWKEFKGCFNSGEYPFTYSSIDFAEKLTEEMGYPPIVTFLARLRTKDLRSYAFWGLNYFREIKDITGSPFPDLLVFSLPDYDKFSTATEEERLQRKKELEEFISF